MAQNVTFYDAAVARRHSFQEMSLNSNKGLPSNRPEKLSVARQRFFFLFLFLASGMSMGWLEGISANPRGFN